VKSGKKGSVRSMDQFLEEKDAPYGIRFSLENHGQINKIWIIPLYAIGEFMRSAEPE
jgi:hypothetical protein